MHLPELISDLAIMLLTAGVVTVIFKNGSARGDFADLGRPEQPCRPDSSTYGVHTCVRIARVAV